MFVVVTTDLGTVGGFANDWGFIHIFLGCWFELSWKRGDHILDLHDG